MAKPTGANPDLSKIVPTGKQIRGDPTQFIPNQNNPRRLFDPAPLQDLKENIRSHGVLVPITVFPLPNNKFQILDGARRHRCCLDLIAEGHKVDLPAYVVEPPDRLTGTLYMFNIHNFREPWELVPTALSLKDVMEDVKETDSKKLSVLTGLSEPQIERCKKILEFPSRFHELSLDADPAKRIPSNFWIEAHPILAIAEESVPSTVKALGGRYGVTDRLVKKYQTKAIKSVIHFRRIVEAFENTENDEKGRKGVVLQFDRFLSDEAAETRDLFDNFVHEQRKIQRAVEACREFRTRLEQIKLEHAVDKDELTKELQSIRDYIIKLLEALKGDDPPRPISKSASSK